METETTVKMIVYNKLVIISNKALFILLIVIVEAALFTPYIAELICGHIVDKQIYMSIDTRNV